MPTQPSKPDSPGTGGDQPLPSGPASEADHWSAVRTFTRGARRDALLYFPAALVPSLVGALTAAVFTRMFSTADWGYYTLAISVTTGAAAVLASWHELSTLRYLSSERGTLGKEDGVPIGLPVRLLVWNTAFFVAAGAIALIVLTAFHPDMLGLGLAALFFGTLSVAATGLGAIERAFLRIWPVTLSRLVSSVLGFLLALLAVSLLGTYPSLIIVGPAIGMAFATALLTVDVRKLVPRRRENLTRERPAAVGQTARSYLRFGLPLLGFYIAGQLLFVSDRYLLHAFRGPTEVGVYSPNYTIGMLVVSLVGMPIVTANQGRLMQFADLETTELFSETTRRVTRDFLLTSVPIVVWAALAAEDISAILLGPDFRVAWTVIPPVLFGTLAWALGMLAHKGLEAKQRSVTLLVMASISCAVNIGLNLVLIPRYGYMAAAWSTLAAYLLYPIMAYFVTRRVLAWRVPWTTVGSLTVGGVAAFVAVRFGVSRIPVSSPIVSLILIGAVTLILMASVLLATREIRLASLAGVWTRLRGGAGHPPQSSGG